MLESLVEWMNYPLYYAIDGAAPPARTGASRAKIYPYGPFPGGDGKVVMLGLQNEREWVAFCEKVLLQPFLARRTVLDQLEAQCRARRVEGVDRRCVRVPDCRAGRGPARRSADRQCTGQ